MISISPTAFLSKDYLSKNHKGAEDTEERARYERLSYSTEGSNH